MNPLCGHAYTLYKVKSLLSRSTWGKYCAQQLRSPAPGSCWDRSASLELCWQGTSLTFGRLNDTTACETQFFLLDRMPTAPQAATLLRHTVHCTCTSDQVPFSAFCTPSWQVCGLSIGLPNATPFLSSLGRTWHGRAQQTSSKLVLYFNLVVDSLLLSSCAKLGLYGTVFRPS